MIRAALLDERNIYIGIDELDNESQLTSRHLPQISECDLAINRYQWIPNDGNPFGGSFMPVGRTMPGGLQGAPNAELVLAKLVQHVMPNDEDGRQYRDWYESTVDAPMQARQQGER